MDGWSSKSGSGLPGGSRLEDLPGGAGRTGGDGGPKCELRRARTGSHPACATSS